ncbi:unnamed protein product [Calypogeia fissa]
MTEPYKGKSKIEERTVDSKSDEAELDPESDEDFMVDENYEADSEVPSVDSDSEETITRADIDRVEAGLADPDPIMRVENLLKAFEDFRIKYKNADKNLSYVKAWRKLRKYRDQVNGKEAISGQVMGVKVGDEFTYRAATNLICLHRPFRSGIDSITEKNKEYKDRTGTPCSVAVSVLFSPTGNYYNQDNRDTILYSGQGGKTDVSGKPIDQELVRGNLALLNSHEQHLPVRVLRGQKNPRGKVTYKYLGLYDVVGPETLYNDSTGSAFYGFKLSRQEGQGDCP